MLFRSLLGYEEILLETGDNRNQEALKLLRPGEERKGDLRVEEDDRSVRIKGADFTYVYEKRSGLFSSIQYGGREYLDRPMELNIWRAPTDNDMYIKNEWKRAQYDKSYARAYETQILQTDQRVKLKSRLSLAADTIQPILRAEAVWTLDARGGIDVTFQVHRDMEFPELPRFGIRLFLNRKLDQVRYCGLGPYESYRDKCRAALYGQYDSSVQGLMEDYIRPQENGSHLGCDYVELTNEDFGLTAASRRPFSFQASVYPQEELERKAHNYELMPCGSTVLCLDYAQNGIGSNSCGPLVLKQYRLDRKSVV